MLRLNKALVSSTTILSFALSASAALGSTSTGISPRAPLAIYEIFPRSFQDSGRDGIGDLAGVTKRLDDIRELGVDALWLMPVFMSPSTHGYDVTDYDRLSPDYGDDATFAQLIREAHARGMKVFLDLPVNSTSREHPWFAASASDETGPSGPLYLWSPHPLSWPGAKWQKIGRRYYMSSFSPALPDLNWRNEEVYQRVRSIALEWTKKGVDGFRLDAAKHLVKGPNGEINQSETHEIWRRLTRDVRQVNPQAYFIGEVWDSAEVIATYYGSGMQAGAELDAAFDFPVMYAIRESVSAGHADPLLQALNYKLRLAGTVGFASPFLGNHDLSRLATELEGDARKIKLASFLQLTLPGTPTLYYGDEIGLRDGQAPEHRNDLEKRTPMIWNDDLGHGFSSTSPWLPFSAALGSVTAQKADDQSVWANIRDLLQLRKEKRSLREGDLEAPARPSANVLTYWRRAGNSLALVAANLGDQISSGFDISLPAVARSREAARVIFGDVDLELGISRGRLHVGPLDAKSGVVVDLTGDPTLGARR